MDRIDCLSRPNHGSRSPLCAGLLVYRIQNGPQILLAHPGAPFWSTNAGGSWSIPNGMADSGDLLACARREFTKETGLIADGEFISLTPVEQKSGKHLQAFAAEIDLELKNFRSNKFSLEWPPGSGRWESFPEIDQIEYFGLRTALRKILPYQWPLLLELSEKLGWRIRGAHQR
jgi:predicted NUDIX family NTP pyrophosphohydrolase